MIDWSFADWVDAKYNWKPREIPALPPRLLIDFATKCNLRCQMCPVWGDEDDEAIEAVKGTMEIEAARKMLDEIAAAKPLIQPSLYGEPLLIPKLKDRIKDLKDRGISIALNTNGLTLNEDIAEFLVEQQVDSVMFSIDSVTKGTLKKIRGIDKLAKIEAAVMRMLTIRGENVKPRIGVSFTIQNENRHEVDAFVNRWVGVVDVVRTGYVFENGTFPEMNTKGERLPCPALYNTLPVHNDGQATICCLDGFRQTNVGNVFKEGVAAVWQGEAFAKVRYFHETHQWDEVPFCKDCNGWAQHEFDEEILNGLLIRRSPQFTYYNKIARLSNWKGRLLGNHPAPPQSLSVT
jgi:MoaA/NifB/PqqE/SkfB family radical SAM enzyme